MGFYVEVPAAINKAQQLKQIHNARTYMEPASLADVPRGKILICVVENGLFDAAAIIYSEAELNDFRESTDNRPRTWLLLDIEEVVALKPHLSEYLRGERSWDD